MRGILQDPHDMALHLVAITADAVKSPPQILPSPAAD